MPPKKPPPKGAAPEVDEEIEGWRFTVSIDISTSGFEDELQQPFFRYAMPTEVEEREGLPARPAPYSRVSACASTLNAKGPARVTVSAAVGAR